MTHPPKLTDRSQLVRYRLRAAKAPVLFLQDIAAQEVQERLMDINRDFKAPAIVTGWPEFWGRFFPNAVIAEDTEELGLTSASHDLVIHGMGLHWADDPVGQLIQCRQALKPDGLFIATLFGGQTLSELRSVLAQAEADITGGLSPRVAPMAEIRDLGGLLQRAGFALPVADTVEIPVSYRDMFHLMHDLRYMGEGNALAARHRAPLRRDVIARASELYDCVYPSDDGRIRATFEIAVLTGWAPDESQPKPLRPGSATTSLADALGTAEVPLKP